MDCPRCEVIQTPEKVSHQSRTNRLWPLLLPSSLIRVISYGIVLQKQSRLLEQKACFFVIQKEDFDGKRSAGLKKPAMKKDGKS